jgi:hypothetical protein
MNMGDTQGLEWFRPPERKTLRPLVCCIVCEDLEPGAKKLELVF